MTQSESQVKSEIEIQIPLETRGTTNTSPDGRSNSNQENSISPPNSNNMKADEMNNTTPSLVNTSNGNNRLLMVPNSTSSSQSSPSGAGSPNTLASVASSNGDSASFSGELATTVAAPKLNSKSWLSTTISSLAPSMKPASNEDEKPPEDSIKNLPDEEANSSSSSSSSSSRSSSKSVSSSQQQHQQQQQPPTLPNLSSPDKSKRLHISNIPFRFRDPDLRQLFGRFGTILDVEIIFNERGSKGFGFVTFASAKEAAEAKLQLNGTSVEGRKIEVNDATARVQSNKTSSSSMAAAAATAAAAAGGCLTSVAASFLSGGGNGHQSYANLTRSLQQHQQHHNQQQHNQQQQHHHNQIAAAVAAATAAATAAAHNNHNNQHLHHQYHQFPLGHSHLTSLAASPGGHHLHPGASPHQQAAFSLAAAAAAAAAANAAAAAVSKNSAVANMFGPGLTNALAGRLNSTTSTLQPTSTTQSIRLAESSKGNGRRLAGTSLTGHHNNLSAGSQVHQRHTNDGLGTGSTTTATSATNGGAQSVAPSSSSGHKQHQVKGSGHVGSSQVSRALNGLQHQQQQASSSGGSPTGSPPFDPTGALRLNQRDFLALAAAAAAAAAAATTGPNGPPNGNTNTNQSARNNHQQQHLAALSAAYQQAAAAAASHP